MGRFRACYQREYAKNPALIGTVTLRFSINQKGRVEGAVIAATTLNSPAVERCMLQQIHGVIFAPPEGGQVLINYPFSFSGM